MEDDEPPSDDKRRSVHERDIASGETSPQIGLLSAVAEFEDVDETELEPLYPQVDHLVDQLYSEPPSAEAQAELTFSYEGYRITLYQDGHATFQEID